MDGKGKELETARLTLRAPRPEDAAVMLEIRNSQYVTRYNVMEPINLERMLKKLEEDAASDRALYLEEKSSGRVMGAVWLEEDSLRYGPSAMMLEYYLGEEYAGKGYMTEALEAVLGYAFGDLGADLASARVFADNPGSVRVLEKLGFLREGELRRAVRSSDGVLHNDLLFSLLREEYKEARHV